MEYRVPSINSIQITGNLVNDADIKYTPSGRPVVNFRIASTRRYKPKDSNDWKEETIFLDAVLFGEQAERIHEKLKKGFPVYIEGRLRQREWEDKDGQKKSKIEIVARRVQVLKRTPKEEEQILEGEEDLPF